MGVFITSPSVSSTVLVVRAFGLGRFFFSGGSSSSEKSSLIGSVKSSPWSEETVSGEEDANDLRRFLADDVGVGFVSVVFVFPFRSASVFAWVLFESLFAAAEAEGDLSFFAARTLDGGCEPSFFFWPPALIMRAIAASSASRSRSSSPPPRPDEGVESSESRWMGSGGGGGVGGRRRGRGVLVGPAWEDGGDDGRVPALGPEKERKGGRPTSDMEREADRTQGDTRLARDETARLPLEVARE